MIESALNAHVSERAIAVIAVKAGTAVRARDRDVKPPVIVVIENSNAAPAAGFVEPQLRRDVFITQAGFPPARLQFHAVLFGDFRRIATRSLRRKP